MADIDVDLSLGLLRTAGSDLAVSDRGRRHLALRQLDRIPQKALSAIGLEPYEVSVTYASPARVATTDGSSYWLKNKAQRGLSVELIAGRLVALLGAGPLAQVVVVPAVVFRDDPRLGRFEGAVVGIKHLPETISAQHVGALLGPMRFDPRQVDGASRARVVAAQTWLNVDDAQVRIGLLDGMVHSVDHGVCLDARLRGRPTNIVVTPIPGVSPELGRDWALMSSAVEAIEAVSEEMILAAVSGMPEDHRWQGAFARRLAIAEWLIKRQRNIGEVMRAWCRLLA